jgi:hypothetical protein
MIEPNFAEFGRRMYERLRTDENYFGTEGSLDEMEDAIACGLADAVKYDPELHGYIEGDPEPGDEIWIWRVL